VGESKTFPLQFPDDDYGQEVAGKEADFLVTDEEDRGRQPARSSTTPSPRARRSRRPRWRACARDVRRNLEREVRFRCRRATRPR
jgi:trigger factor